MTCVSHLFRAPFKDVCFLLPVYLSQQDSVPFEIDRHLRVIRPKGVLVERKDTALEWLGLVIQVLILVEGRHAEERDAGAWMLRTQHLLLDGQGTLVERLRLRIASP